MMIENVLWLLYKQRISLNDGAATTQSYGRARYFVVEQEPMAAKTMLKDFSKPETESPEEPCEVIYTWQSLVDLRKGELGLNGKNMLVEKKFGALKNLNSDPCVFSDRKSGGGALLSSNISWSRLVVSSLVDSVTSHAFSS